MISFVTWVNNPQEYERLKASVTFASEWIEVDQVCSSMAEAYHAGQALATGDVVCYVHQDVIIHDPQFEQKVMRAVERYKDAGFIGVIGNLKRSERCWWELPRRFLRGRVVQSDKTGKQRTTVLDFGRYTGPCAQMDGLMMITPRRDWQWPDIEGIHFTDLLMCYEARERGLMNYLTDVEVEHCSWGEIQSKGFAKNYNKYLAHISGSVPIPYIK